MYTIPQNVLENSELLPIAKLAYAVLLKQIQLSGVNTCRISYDTLADILKISRLTSKVAFEMLYDAKLIDRTKDHRGRFIYSLKEQE